MASFLETAAEIAREAGAVVANYAAQRIGYELKGEYDLVTDADQPTASWWIYRRYAEMSGRQAAVTAGLKVDGPAAADPGSKQAIILLGSRAGIMGPVSVKLENLPSYLQKNGTAHLKVERMPEGSAALQTPVVIFELTLTLSNNTVILPIIWRSPFDAYVITLST